jgi:hypothetical protein
MIYGGGSLAMTITDTVTHAVFTHTWTIDIPTTIGATTAYAGFTGGTGGITATQNILTWTLGPIPIVGFAPASPIDFPDVDSGTSGAPFSVTVTNSGGAPLNISGVTVMGTNSTDFVITSNSCTTAAVAINATCTVAVTFTPSGTGERQANLQFADDASSSPQILALSGNGLAPATPGLTVTPSSPILLPGTTQGVTSSAVIVTVTNSGNANLNISAVALTGVNAGDFALGADNCIGRAVAANATCTVGITFTPSTTGARQASLQITDNAPASPQVVAITGNGLAPAAPGLTVVPNAPIMFPNTTQGATSAPLVVAVANSGNANLNISGLTLTGVNAGDFALAANTCAGTIAAATICTVGITFTPSATGARQASLQITDNVPASPQSFTLIGTGTAKSPTAPAAVITPATVVVAGTQGTASSSTNIVISNSGNAALHISRVVFGGANVSEFVNPSNPCGAPIDANTSCSISVTFAPTGVGARTETVTITDDAPNSPQVLTINGTASPVYTLTSGSSTLTAAVTAGQAAQYTLQLAPGVGYTGPVTMMCSGAPATTACTVTNPIPLTSGTPATVSVSVTTMKSSLVPNTVHRPSPPPSLYLMLLALSMCGITLSLLKQLGNTGRPMPGWLAHAASFAVLAFAGYVLTGCASGGVSVVTPTPPVSGTQKGSYTLTLTPTASSMSGKPLQLSPIQLTLNVN